MKSYTPDYYTIWYDWTVEK